VSQASGGGLRSGVCCDFEENLFQQRARVSTVAPQFIYRAGGEEFALVDNADAVGDFFRNRQCVCGKEDGGAVAGIAKK